MAEVVWRANPGPQREFMFGPLGRTREILYGGAKGGGKSATIGPKALIHVSENPQHGRVLILREDYPQLRDLIDKMAPLCRAAGGRWNSQEKRWRFPKGATITFGHLTRGCDPYWGQEYTLIMVDELTRAIKAESDYLKLRASLRNPHGIQGQIIGYTNPGGAGHAWVQERFMRTPPREVTEGRVYLPALLSDNPHLPDEYRQDLEGLGDAEREAYLHGKWDAFQGSVFRLERGVHTWTWAQFYERTGETRPPAHWNRYRSYDHGLAAPGAAYWYAVNTIDIAFVYRELYTVAKDSKGAIVPNKGAAYPPRDVARMIATRSEGEAYAGSWSGRDLFDETRADHGGGVKLSSHFEAEKVYFQAWTTGPGSRIAGKAALHQRLAFKRDEQGRVTQWPRIIFIEEECPHAIRTLPMLEYSKTQAEQVDDSGEDHCFDSLAGFCKMRPVAARAPGVPEPDWMRARTGGGRL